MENIIRGWITSAIGAIILLCDIVHFFGLYTFPNPSGLSNNQECAIAFIVGLILLLVPASKLESFLENLINKFLEYFFNKKIDKQ